MVVKPKPDASDYCVIDVAADQRLSNFERLSLVGGEELDRALQWIAKQFVSFSHSNRLGTLNTEHVLQAREFYAQWRNDPVSFLGTLGSVSNVKEVELHGLPSGKIVDVNFDHGWTAHHQSVNELRSLFPNSNGVRARMWKHATGARSTIVAVHGWAMGDQRVNGLAFLPGLFYQSNVNIVLVELPYHGRRKLPAAAKKDTVFPSSDLYLTNETVAQAVAELRAVVQLVKNLTDGGPVGMIGMSLGAYLTEITSAFEELSAVIAVVPLVDMAEVAWEVLTRTETFSGLATAGIEFQTFRDIFSVHAPLGCPRKVARESALILAGLGDHVVPSRQPKLLWDFWKRPNLIWFSGGHSAQVSSAKAFPEILKFLSDRGFADPIG